MEAEGREWPRIIVMTEGAPAHPPAVLRNAESGDAAEVAGVLAECFPALYRSTFGRQGNAAIASLLNDLYDSGHLSLADTRLCDVAGRVAGVMILHTGQPIGRGTMLSFWRLLRSRYGMARTPRMFLGGILANLMLERRIPCAADLVYVEALAVSEAHRNRGIGSLLLADAEQWALERGRTRLALHVLAGNAGARRLYRRVGFRPWHEVEGGPPARVTSSASAWTAVLMARRLSPEPQA